MHTQRTGVRQRQEGNPTVCSTSLLVLDGATTDKQSEVSKCLQPPKKKLDVFHVWEGWCAECGMEFHCVFHCVNKRLRSGMFCLVAGFWPLAVILVRLDPEPKIIKGHELCSQSVSMPFCLKTDIKNFSILVWTGEFCSSHLKPRRSADRKRHSATP